MLDTTSGQDLCLCVAVSSNSHRRMPVIDRIQLTWMTFFDPAIDTNTHPQRSLWMESFFMSNILFDPLRLFGSGSLISEN